MMAIYLDANATSRVRPEAAQSVAALLAAGPGNPSSVHASGRRARALVKEARRAVLALLNPGGSPAGRLVFTSGGTEACNQMIYSLLGPALELGRQRGHLITSSIEHPAVQEACAALERAGWEATRIEPQPDGVLLPEAAASALRESTALVCLMGANNETGAVQPIEEIARQLRRCGFHGPIVSDMVQALGKTVIRAEALFTAGVTAIAISGHKAGALPGTGAVVYAQDGRHLCFPVHPLLLGGPQEERLRAGTENLSGIVSFGAAAKAMLPELEREVEHRSRLREELWSRLSVIEGARRLGPGPDKLVSNTLLVRFAGCRGDDLVVALDLRGVWASTGSACASGKQSVSEAVKALRLEAKEAREVIRFSLDWDSTAEEISRAAAIVSECVADIRQHAPRPHEAVEEAR